MSTPRDSFRAFAPASVSNVACGFDAFGFAIEGPGDEVEASFAETAGVTIVAIEGDGGALPREADRNTAGLAAQAVLERSGSSSGVALHINKRMPLASGLGSSAASAVAAAIAVDALLETELPREELLLSALEGEVLASGGEHGDNLAPSLYGGFVLVRALRPRPDIVALPVPAGLTAAVVRPSIAVETHSARALLGDRVPLASAVTQWANTAALVAALFRSDMELLSRSLHDAIAEPVRRDLVPGFQPAREAAIGNGALGCSLSGSGPALFAICRDEATGAAVRAAMVDAFESTGRGVDSWVSPVGSRGAYILEGSGNDDEPVAATASA